MQSHGVSSASQAILDKTKAVIVQLAPMVFGTDPAAFDPDIVGDAQAQAAIIRFNFAAVWRGRSVGLTRSGKFFSAMNQVQPGDVIVALEGSTDRLWTLRAEPDGQCHRLVGDINVPGYMQGEIYMNKNPSDVDVEFRIV